MKDLLGGVDKEEGVEGDTQISDVGNGGVILREQDTGRGLSWR